MDNPEMKQQQPDRLTDAQAWKWRALIADADKARLEAERAKFRAEHFGAQMHHEHGLSSVDNVHLEDGPLFGVIERGGVRALKVAASAGVGEDTAHASRPRDRPHDP